MFGNTIDSVAHTIEIMLSEFWKLGVQDQRVLARLVFSCGLCLHLAECHLLDVSSPALLSLWLHPCVCVYPNLPFLQGPQSDWIKTNLKGLFVAWYSTPLFKSLLSKSGCIRSTGFGTSNIWILGEKFSHLCSYWCSERIQKISWNEGCFNNLSWQLLRILFALYLQIKNLPS